MRKIIFLILTFIVCPIFSQRGETGDKTFKNRFPDEVFNAISSSSLELINDVDHKIKMGFKNEQ